MLTRNDLEYLPTVLNFLFEALRDPTLASVASKAILTACSSCRTTLVTELQAFASQYEAILSWDSVESETKERVIGGMSAIIQALNPEESKEAPLSMLLRFIDQDARACMQPLGRLNPEEREVLEAKGICALRCMASMGRALQIPDGVTIDLDTEMPQSEFW